MAQSLSAGINKTSGADGFPSIFDMVQLHTVQIEPPLINSSCAWSSNLEQLSALYESPYTGAITTRTATLHGYNEDASNTVAFSTSSLTTINSYGYSPHPLSDYFAWTRTILEAHPTSTKPVIISITAPDAPTLKTMVDGIQGLRQTSPAFSARIAVELNTSCPNIKGSPPSGYSFSSLTPLIEVLFKAFKEDPSLTIGLKLPPYVYGDQYDQVISGLQGLVMGDATPIAYLACTNTLGNSLLLDDNLGFAVPTGLGGLGGDSLHALALGNVFNFKQRLSKAKGLENTKIIGIGGVTSKEAVKRMRTAGADVTGSATLFGKLGVHAFKVLGEE